MMSVSTSEESERRLGEAMRAHASGVGHPGFVGRNPATVGTPPEAPNGYRAGQAPERQPAQARPGTDRVQRSHLLVALTDARLTLLLALLGGVVLGVALALLSLLVPGALPPLG